MHKLKIKESKDILCIISFSALICFFIPGQLFILAEESVFFNYVTYTFLGLPLFLLVSLLLVAVRVLTGSKIISVINIITITCAIMAVYFPLQSSAITGNIEDISRQSSENIANLLRIFISLAIAIVVVIRVRRWVPLINWVILISTVAVTAYALFGPANNKIPKFIAGKSRSPEEITATAALGKNNNIVILILDAVSGSNVVSVLNGDNDLQASFMGFTVFKNMFSPGAYTEQSLPVMLSGDPFILLKHDSLSSALEEAANSSFLTDAIDSDWDVANFYVHDGKNQRVASSPSTGFAVPPLFSAYSIKNAIHFYLISLRRILPGFLLQFLGESVEASSEAYWKGVNSYSFHSFIKFVDSLKVDKTIENKLIVFHTLFTHGPNYYDNNFVLKDKKNDINLPKLGLLLVKKFMSKIKELDIYDRTSLLVISDHGGGIQIRKDVKSKNHILRWRTGRYNSLLMVKNRGVTQNKAVIFEETPMTTADLRKIISKMTENKSNWFPPPINSRGVIDTILYVPKGAANKGGKNLLGYKFQFDGNFGVVENALVEADAKLVAEREKGK